jgi:transmembrane protein
MKFDWVNAIVENRAFQILARIVLTLPFWGAAIEHGIGFKGWVGAMAHFNLNPPLFFAVFTLLTLVVGTILVVFTNKWVWLGAGALGIFTFLTIFIAHAFWDMKGPQAQNEFHTVLEHMAIIGGLMVMASLAASAPKANPA